MTEVPVKIADEEDAFLDSIIQKAEEEKKVGGAMISYLEGPSVLFMDRTHFNYKKELKSLFAKSA